MGKQRARTESKGELYVFDKAERLITEGRVRQISKYMFYVIGDHGKYFVEVIRNIPKCNCPGFKKRGFCSHSIAVLLVITREDYRIKLSKAEVEAMKRNLEYIRRGEIPR